MTSQELRRKCVKLRNRDLTLGEICRVLGRSKSTVYFHIKDVPKSVALRQKIKVQSAKRLRHNLKGVSWLGRHCKDFKRWSPKLVNLVAHFTFDGQLRPASASYDNRNSKLIAEVKKNMLEVYIFPPKIVRNAKTDVLRLAYYKVELANLLRRKKRELLEQIIFLPASLQRVFLRVFFDDEGCVYFQIRKCTRQVRGFQHNFRVLTIVRKLLLHFGINSEIDERFHEVTISGPENLKRFAQKINFSRGVRVNGKRSNSIWRKSLEKREILRRALASYKIK